jgi:dipeptidyl aminopeptidase/acylaminoacyl peptidase
MKARILCWILVGAGWLDAQVVLSRRDYIEHGRTFAQIWMADAGTLNFRQLTHSGRDHSEPVCSRDGKLIYFVSDRDVERSRNSHGDYHLGEREVWAYDRQTGQERFIWRTSREDGLDLNGVTANGGLLVRVGTEIHSLLRSLWIIDNVDEAAVSPDGRRLALVIAESYDKQGQSQNARLFVADAATGRPRTEVGKYDVPEWSQDGTRIAAFFDGGLAILDPTTHQEIERVVLPKRNAPSQDIVWSPDGKSLLAGLYGENGGAGDPQNDYLLLDPPTRTWTPEMTARRLLWLQGETVLYLRPYETTPLAPASPHNVWTSQLAAYDLASRKDKALTSGLVLNDYLTTCGH